MTPPTKPSHDHIYFYRLVKTTISRWISDEAPMMGAALAYYSLFSIAPMLLVALAIAGLLYGPDAARGELQHYLTDYFGASGAESVQTMLTAAEKNRGEGKTAVVLGLVILLFGASSVFAQLKMSLNRIWKVEEPKHTGVKAFVIDRALAILMVIVVGLLLLSSLLLSTAVNRIANFAAREVLPFAPETLQAIDLGLTFLLLSVMFSIIFRYLPDIRIGWRSVVLGAVVTAVLFIIGRYVIGLYIAKGGMTTGYGAAGSILILLIWIYYSAQIFLFGAEFTHVYSRAHHLPAEPIADEDGELIEPE